MEPSTVSDATQASIHTAQFYDDAAFPAVSIARHLATGLNSGCPALVIATPSHSAAIARALGPGAAEVTWLDATETLSQFLGSNGPDSERFSRSVGNLVRSTADARHPVFAYGEMVDLLTRRGDIEGALHLEDLWNGLAEECALQLLCAYSLSSFCRHADSSEFDEVCRRHTEVAPTEGLLESQREPGWSQTLAGLERRARLGDGIETKRATLETGLADAGRLRDELIGIASHELRNPVHVLSLNIRAAVTALDAGAPAASVRQRLVNAETQVTRLATLLDRMLHTSGLLVGQLSLEPADFDLADAVSSVLETMQARLATSNMTVDLQPATGRWDRGRVEQIVEHLLCHAVSFGSGQPIRVSLQGFPDFVYLSLCDWGVADDSDAPIPTMVIPKDQGRDPATTDFGLWTARQLSEAMGGTIATSRPSPNRFRVILTLPRQIGSVHMMSA